MVKLPTSDRLQSRAPQSTLALQNVPVSQEYDAMQGVARGLGRIGQVNAQIAYQERRVEQLRQQELEKVERMRQQELEKYEMARQKAAMISNFNTALSTVEQSPDYHSYNKMLDDSAQSIQDDLNKNEFVKENGLAKSYLNLEFQKLYDNARLKTKDLVSKKQNDATVASLFNSANELTQSYAMSDAGQQQEILEMFTAMNMSAYKTGAISNAQMSKNIYNFKLNADRNYIQSLPPEQQLDVITGDADTNDAIIDLKIAKLESSFKPYAKNKNSSASGLYQQIDDNAKQYGVKDRFDPKQSYEGFVKFKKDNIKTLKNNLKRDPRGWELYLAHQQGGKGASVLLANPDKNAVDALQELGISKEKAKRRIKLNGGKENMTAKEFAHIWRDKYEKADISDAPSDIVQLITGGQKKLSIPLSEQTKILTTAQKQVQTKKETDAVNTVSNFVLNQFSDDYKQQVSMVNSMDNLTGDTRKKVMSIIDGNHRQQEIIRKETTRENTFKVLDIINEGGNINDVPPEIMLELSSKDRSYLQKVYDKKNFTAEKKLLKEKQETIGQRLLFAEVQDEYYEGGVEALKEYDVARLAGELNESQFNKYRSWMQPPEGSEPDLIKANRQQINTIFKDTAAILGIDNKKSEDDIVKQSLLRENLETNIEKFTLENNRPPKYTEVQDIKNNLIREITLDDGFLWDTKKRVFEATDEELEQIVAPDDAKEKILKDLQKYRPNQAYSDDDINKIYRAQLKK